MSTETEEKQNKGGTARIASSELFAESKGDDLYLIRTKAPEAKIVAIMMRLTHTIRGSNPWALYKIGHETPCDVEQYRNDIFEKYEINAY